MKFPTLKFMLIRFSEAGTWRAISLALLGVGFQIPDSQWQHVATAGMAIAALISVFIPELGSPDRVAPPPSETTNSSAIPVLAVGDK